MLRLCEASATTIVAGDNLTVTATGLPPSQYAHVLLGEEDIGDYLIDSGGNFSANFTVPSSTPVGPYLITVSTPSATPAACGINVTD